MSPELSPQRLDIGTRHWIELPDGFGRHGAMIADAARTETWGAPGPTEELELTLTITHVPDSEAAELDTLGLLEPHRTIDVPALGTWKIEHMEASLEWQAIHQHGGGGGSLRDHAIRLRLRRQP
jgi:hypothetical protein